MDSTPHISDTQRGLLKAAAAQAAGLIEINQETAREMLAALRRSAEFARFVANGCAAKQIKARAILITEGGGAEMRSVSLQTMATEELHAARAVILKAEGRP